MYGGRQQPQQMQVPTQQQFIKAIPVTSFDEAKAAMIDFDGSLFIFANIQNGEIYTKQLNINTGSCDLKVYSLLNNLGNQGAAPQVANVQEPEPQIEYATKAEVLQLQEQISKLEGVVNNAVDKSNAVAADTGLFVVVSSNLCTRNCGTVTHIPVTTTSSVAESKAFRYYAKVVMC